MESPYTKSRLKMTSTLYIPLGTKELVLAAFEITEDKSILYSYYKTIEGLHKGITEAIQKGADYISIRIIKESPPYVLGELE